MIIEDYVMRVGYKMKRAWLHHGSNFAAFSIPPLRCPLRQPSQRWRIVHVSGMCLIWPPKKVNFMLNG